MNFAAPYIVKVIAGFAFIAALALPMTDANGASYLINAQQANYQSEPKFIRDRFAFIDSLPFDGMTISSETGRVLMDGTPRSYAQMSLDFGPLNHLSFKRQKHNFAVVNVRRPADFFGDWTVTVENFRLLAKRLRASRVEGIFFDNEEYAGGVFNYPENCSYPEKTLAQYQDQARMRGREVMQAMMREYPALVVMPLHGPYSSFAGTPNSVRGGQTDWTKEELRGAFSVGLIEGLGGSATLVDGGEVYAYRTAADFQGSYDFRKTTIASAAAACPFIPALLRPAWPGKVSVAFGVYNLGFNGSTMNPSILRTTLENALRRADRYVWLYTEGLNWNAPGETSRGWMDAAAGARAATASPVPTPGPWVEITSPGHRGLLNRVNPLTLTAEASSPGRTISKVEFFRGTTKVGESVSAPYAVQWVNPPAGTFRITAKATDDNGVTAISSGILVTFSSRFVARINFQPIGVSPSVGYRSDSGASFGARSLGLTYGWNVSHTDSTRQRRANNLDLYLATLCQIQSDGKWEIAVPNGNYRVTVGIGDGDAASTYTLNVEGVNYWTAEPLEANRFIHRARTVTVTDGRLTLDEGNGDFESTRVNYLTVTGITALPR